MYHCVSGTLYVLSLILIPTLDIDTIIVIHTGDDWMSTRLGNLLKITCFIMRGANILTLFYVVQTPCYFYYAKIILMND